MPVEIQARIQIRFRNHLPLTHPFPNNIETIFDYVLNPYVSIQRIASVPIAHLLNPNYSNSDDRNDENRIGGNFDVDFIDNEQNNGTDFPPVDAEGVNQMQDSDIFQEQSQAEDTPFVAAPISEIDEIEDLQNSLRTFRLSNERLSLLLDKNRVELAKKATIVARLEQGIFELTLEIVQKENAQLYSEGKAIDLTSQLLIFEFNQSRSSEQIQRFEIKIQEKDAQIEHLKGEIENSNE